MPRPSVAVIDDDPVLLDILQDVLHDAGYAPRCWPSGPDAVLNLVQQPPDLIILDLRFGQDPQSGWHLLGLLRSEPRTAAVPVILLSADHEFLHLRDRIIRTRYHAVPLAKPFALDAFLTQVQQSLAGHGTAE
jgi:CheY-like chemotaxis protein